MSSPIRRVSIGISAAVTSFRSTGTGSSSCRRENASSWRVSCTARSAARSSSVMVGTVDQEVVSAATAVIGKGGTVVITGLANPAKLTVQVSGTDLTLNQKTIKGSLFGSMNPQYDIVKLLRMYDAGVLKLDELITKTYTLEEVNEGYQDLRDGKNIRGVIHHAA